MEVVLIFGSPLVACLLIRIHMEYTYDPEMSFAALTFDCISAVELVRMWEHCVRTWSGHVHVHILCSVRVFFDEIATELPTSLFH